MESIHLLHVHLLRCTFSQPQLLSGLWKSALHIGLVGITKINDYKKQPHSVFAFIQEINRAYIHTQLQCNEAYMRYITFSDKVFNETNPKDRTGIRVASCPWAANSCGMKNKFKWWIPMHDHTTDRSRRHVWESTLSLHLDVGIRSRVSLPWLLQKQHLHVAARQPNTVEREEIKNNTADKHAAQWGRGACQQQQHPTHWQVQRADKQKMLVISTTVDLNRLVTLMK